MAEANHDTFKTIMDDELKHVNVNVRLAQQIKRYETEFLNKNDNHVNFFSSPLIGVWPVKFLKEDLYEWFDSILHADDIAITRRIKNIPEVDESWVRMSDAMNVSCCYLAYRFLQANMPQKAREEAAMSCLIIMHFKFLTSIMSHGFSKAPANPAIAWSVYNSLSNKFTLKQYGSWYGLFQARAAEIISNTSVHKNTLKTFEPVLGTPSVAYLIQDLQVRVKQLVKKQYDRYVQVKASDAAIVKTSHVATIDGEGVIRDMQRNFTKYTSYLKTISSDKTRFIKDDLVTVVSNAMYTMPVEPLVDCLTYITSVANTPKGREVDELLKEIIVHAIYVFMKDSPTGSHVSDITGMLQRLRLSYISSQAKDPSLLKIRKAGEKLVKQIYKTRNPALQSSVRTGIFLYVALRVFAINTYR